VTKQQLAVIWIVGLVLSAILVWIGVGQPYLEKQKGRPDPFFAAIEAQKNPELAHQKSEAWQKRTSPNYVIGALAPAVILGGCGLMSAFVKPATKPGSGTVAGA
jgi:hypothetical protein